ncbi:MAG: hypothetical protein NTY73_00290 [Candidatus Micrarchaeota archaeon]|nr:hypothetical protein [Candidatus Micrarchaeota archaeon]
MADVLGVIEEAYEKYKTSWKSVILAFAVIAIIAIIFGLADFLLRLPGELLCDKAQNTLVVLLFCISPVILQYVLNFINGLISLTITMSVIGPLDDVANNRTVSSWVTNFPKQFVNALLVILLRFAVAIVCFAPLAVLAILNISLLVAVSQSKNIGALVFGSGLIVLIIVGIVCVAIFTLVNFLLSFLEIEMVLGGAGIVAAAKKSARLVIGNLADMIVYFMLWFVIGLGVGLLTIVLACTICLLPVAWLIPSLIVAPIQWLSAIILWRRLGGSSEKVVKKRGR